MAKVVFFALPSISVCNTLAPFVDELAAEHEIVWYNTIGFSDNKFKNVQVRSYPPSWTGYNPQTISQNVNYFDFANTLLDSTDSVLDVLISELAAEEFDFVVYSHLAVWGKLLAQRFGKPAIACFTTIVLLQKITQPQFRISKTVALDGLLAAKIAMRLSIRLTKLHQRLNIRRRSNLWDLYTNEGDLNLVFVDRAFQPSYESFNDTFKFVGHPRIRINEKKLKRNLVYISFGTVFNKNTSLYKICIDAIKSHDLDCIVSLGNSPINIEEINSGNDRIKIVRFVDQVEVLQSACLFITHGGTASVNEAIQCRTPMVVIAEIPEQQINGQTIEQLGLGANLPIQSVSSERLSETIVSVLSKSNFFQTNLEGFAGKEITPPARLAVNILNNFFTSRTAEKTIYPV